MNPQARPIPGRLILNHPNSNIMKFLKYLTITALAAAMTSTAAFAQDEGGKKEKDGKKPKGGNMEERFAKMDADSDGEVTMDELKAGLKKPEMAEKMLKAKDTDGNGSLSKDEFTAKRAGGKGKGEGKGKGKGKKKKDAE